MSAALNISSGSFQHNLDRLYTECPNTTHEFLGDSVTARKQEAREAQDTALVLLKQLSGIPQWLTQRTKDCHTPNSKLETLMPALQLLPLTQGNDGLVRQAYFHSPFCMALVVADLMTFFRRQQWQTLSLRLSFPDHLTLPRSYADVAFGHGSPTSNLTRQFLDKESAVMALKDMKVIPRVGTYGDAIQRSCPTWDALNAPCLK
ncbi:Chaperone protein dnaJ 10 [Durusdinium trenchii]|uniref:Chaperone protein dnaJ 10 n=1 Tax=Durusdinium trenchii TaxID=1381693 RepID=A0ABP0KQR5_9DINO